MTKRIIRMMLRKRLAPDRVVIWTWPRMILKTRSEWRDDGKNRNRRTTEIDVIDNSVNHGSEIREVRMILTEDTWEKEMNSARNHLKSSIAILIAVETLEYHDKNWLTTNKKLLNEEKRILLTSMADIVEKCKLDDISQETK